MIATIIENIVNAKLTGYSYYHGSEDMINYLSDQAEFPAIFLDFPIKIDYRPMQSGNLIESAKISIFVFEEDENIDADEKMSEKRVIFDSTKSTCVTIISGLRSNEYIKDVITASTLELNNPLDAGASGQLLQIEVEMDTTNSIC